MSDARKGPIVLLTDFGIEDGYVGVMKGVIQTITPGVETIDLSHHVPPQDIRAGLFLLEHSVDYFPAGTIFLCVVDPGVGTDRGKIAAKTEDYSFVAPDNGLLTPFLLEAEAVNLESLKFRLPNISNTFHGRDIFAPAAAHLSRGVSLSDLGPICEDPVTLDLPSPRSTGNGWVGEVIYVDRFGNAVTNFDTKTLKGISPEQMRILTKGDVEWPYVTAYAETSQGTRCSVIGGFAALELSINCGDASKRYGLATGSEVWIRKS